MAEAALFYRQVLASEPRNSDALHLLGVIAYQEGRLEAAVDLIANAIEINPMVAAYHSNLGNALQALGRATEALSSYEAALRIEPDYAEALSNRGSALKTLGRTEEAVASYDAALRVRPDYAVALSNRGNALATLGRNQEALASYEAALRIKPDYADALSNRGAALLALDRAAEAIASVDAALRIKPDYAEALSNRGGALATLGRYPEALASYEAALRIKPDYADALSNRGTALLALDRAAEAVASFDAALRAKPDYAEAYYNLSTAKTFVFGDPKVAAMHNIYRNPKLSDGERCRICFALGKANDDMEHYGEAFDFYAQGNALRKKALGYSINQDQALFGALHEFFGRETPRQVPLAPTSGAQRPIFIVGMPRSGTTLVEQILASHSQVHGAGELEAMSIAVRAEFASDGGACRFTFAEKALAGIRQRYLAELGELKTSKSVITDKMPINFLWIGFVLEAIPEASIVNLLRDPIAVCWSIFKTYFSSTGLGFAYDLADLVDYYRLYEDLMAFWRKLYPDRIYDLNYQRLTEDQEGQTRALLEYCRLPWEDACLDFHQTKRAVNTASLTQVRRRMYQGSSQAWRKFEPYLGPLIEAFAAASGSTSTHERPEGGHTSAGPLPGAMSEKESRRDRSTTSRRLCAPIAESKETGMAKITIDTREYDVEQLSAEARAQLTSLQLTEARIGELQRDLAIAQTARNAYFQALRAALAREQPPANLSVVDMAATIGGTLKFD